VYFGGRSPGQRNFQNWKGPNEAINWVFQISEVPFEKKRPKQNLAILFVLCITQPYHLEMGFVL
jgi:hypothetical protein